MFLYKIINNEIDSSYLLSKISFKCSRISARSKQTFHMSTARTKYASNAFVRRSCRLYDAKFSPPPRVVFLMSEGRDHHHP